MELLLFEEVAETVRAMAPGSLGPFHSRAHRYGMKCWFGDATPPREHYEAQIISAKHVKGSRTFALEIGFHAEHPKAGDNDAVIARLLDAEKRWRKVLGADAHAGPFLGRADVWRRVSETWADPDLDDDELPVEIAERLTEYVSALEPVLQRARKG